MALNSEDARPAGMSDRERYERIRSWYRANVRSVASGNDHRAENARRSIDYIDNLPPAELASSQQIEELFYEVRYSRLEWAYHESDGQYKMAAYAGAD